MSSDESEEDEEDIEAELEAAATRVTRTATEKRILLYIIAEITGEGSATEKSAPAAPQQTPQQIHSHSSQEIQQEKMSHL